MTYQIQTKIKGKNIMFASPTQKILFYDERFSNHSGLRCCHYSSHTFKMKKNSYFYIEKWTFKIMCEVCYRAKRDKKEAT